MRDSGLTNRPNSPHGQRPIARWLPAIAAVGVLAVVLAAATLGGGDDGADSGNFDGPTDNSDYLVAGLTVPDSTMPAVGIASTVVPIVKTTIASTLGLGSAGPDVVAVQNRLTALGFAPGVADGLFGAQTEQAVWAFEKLVLGTPRAAATGKMSNEMWQQMQDPIVIQPRRPGTGTHVEIYIPEQVAAVFKDNFATLVIHISSGTGKEWCETVKLDTDARGNKLDEPVDKAVCGVAITPGGVFTFERAVAGKRTGPLGGMDNPIYFNYGIAMHGSPKVPLEPASHGCVRMHKTISDSFQTFVHLRDRVYVWGQDGKQPEQYTKQESLEGVFNYPDPNATTTTTTIAPTTTTMAPTTSQKPVPTTTTAAVLATTTTLASTTTAAAPPSETSTIVPQP